MADTYDQEFAALSAAHQNGDLTLFLGAGVSVGSGLPSWDQLVLAMYFDTITKKRLPGWKPFPNYLYAISEWYLGRLQEPLEVTARKLRMELEEGEEEVGGAFLETLHRNLYAGFMDGSPRLDGYGLRVGNKTLNAVAGLCDDRSAGRNGIHSVITYNYDNLIEAAVRERVANPVWREGGMPQEDVIPVYHVHGYVPFDDLAQGSQSHEIVFTEDQYHLAARDAYSWANIVQLRAMSSSVGLMVGLSIADRNIRRLLDAISRSPVRPRLYALLQRPKKSAVETGELDVIHETAKRYFGKFANSGIKARGNVDDEGSIFDPTKVREDHAFPDPRIKLEHLYQREISGIVEAVEERDQEMQEKVLKELGVQPIWYDEHDEVAGLIDRIHRQ